MLANKLTVFIGFHNDADGWASAAPIVFTYGMHDLRLFPLQNGSASSRNSATFVNAVKKHAAQEGTEHFEVFLLDFTLGTSAMQELFDLADDGLNFTWVEHHKISSDVLQSLEQHTFGNSDQIRLQPDNSKAACMLTAELLYERGLICEDFVTSHVLLAIANRDIGLYTMGDSTDQITSALFVLMGGYHASYDINKFIAFYTYITSSTGYEELMAYGKPICEARQLKYQSALSQQFTLAINGPAGWFRCAAVFTSPELITPVATELARRAGFPACALVVMADRITLGFRSLPGASMTALDLAVMLGGAGHEHAAGAAITFEQLKLESDGVYHIQLKDVDM